MREKRLRTARTLRAARAAATGSDSDHHASGIRAPVSRDRWSALRPGDPRLAGDFSAAGATLPHSRAVSGGGQHASGTGGADGGAVGPSGGGEPAGRLGFDQPVGAGGYAWWYIDALSDDGRLALTIIAFIGSVFSPYYAWARRRGVADPLNHCALNVALYGYGRSRWAMTERRSRSVQRSADTLVIGPSALTWDGSAVVVRIDERAVPVPSRLRGVVRLYPTTLLDDEFKLDANGHHRWRPLAPNARVEVDLDRPQWRWRGSGYLDSNRGASPLEDGFACWTWCRVSTRSGAVILYDIERRDGTSLTLGLRATRDGRLIPIEPPPLMGLPTSRWRIPRAVRARGADSKPVPVVLRTLEDTPFYARSLLKLAVLDEPTLAMHESLSLDRFRQMWVQAMLPFRMPRVSR